MGYDYKRPELKKTSIERFFQTIETLQESFTEAEQSQRSMALTALCRLSASCVEIPCSECLFSNRRAHLDKAGHTDRLKKVLELLDKGELTSE